MALEEDVGRMLAERGETLTIAESLTGGLVASRITDVPGSSEYFQECVVAYSNDAKVQLLGVREATLDEHGSVSEETAREMAAGARRLSGADWGVATTGIAGPTGAKPGKPVGLVFVAVAGPGGVRVEHHEFEGDRLAVKATSVEAVLGLLLRTMEGTPPPEGA